MRIKIISDGTSEGTSVVNAETGEIIEHVNHVSWEAHSAKGTPIAILRFVNVETEITSEAVTGRAIEGVL